MGVIEPTHSNTVAGWREWVALPELGVSWIKAKLDTGAHSSAIHATKIEEFVGADETDWVRFTVVPWQKSGDDATIVERQIHDRRAVRSSSGHSEDRIVVLLHVELFGQTVTAETTLTDRSDMGFRMLIGREALSQGFLIDSSASFLGGRAPRAVRRRNQGRD
ncbi:RimK/LysX family protein [uncultured Salinibacterium sp.]|mgnify:FL=1|uniref:ATP-dependent zinc protease family protein n=1 Tax=uncultured Salinibacterium sp. TaxID=459274 RepID=UPI0030DDCADA|tara:strand:- start:64773 stop:65261 length:489 start_codon:yes stop_codon:yes gene_type:complete